jgi:hypothetical protein
MTPEQWSAALALFAAIVVALASFRQWWWITVDGGMPLKPWARAMLIVVVVLLVGALAALLVGALD